MLLEESHGCCTRVGAFTEEERCNEAIDCGEKAGSFGGGEQPHMTVFKMFGLLESEGHWEQHGWFVEQHDEGLGVRALIDGVVAGVAAVKALLVRFEVDVVPLGSVGIPHDACFS